MSFNLFHKIQDIFSPILSDRSIIRYNKTGLLIKQKILPHQLQPNSVDLTLGNSWKTLKHNSSLYYDNVIDPRKKSIYESGKFEFGIIKDINSNSNDKND